jgi:hypothetical protein
VLEGLDGFLHARLDFLDNVPDSHGSIGLIVSGNRLLGAGFGSSFGEALVEAIDAASGIDEHLLAGVERMALAANIDLDVVIPGGAGFEGGAAVRAVDGNFRILRVNLWFHDLCDYVAWMTIKN